MPVESVQNYNITRRNGTLSNVFAGGLLGIAAGYTAKQVLPLDKSERANIPYRSIINVARKETNKRMVNNYSALSKRSEAQDVFIQMIKDKNFKNSTEIIQNLEASKPDVAKEFKKIVKIANRDSQALAKQNAGAYHKFLKCTRPSSGYVGVGAAIGILGGILYNAFTSPKQC